MRPTCLLCFRPDSLCLCCHVQPVHNRTRVIVMQHPRERFHPFGSVRMLKSALANARVEVAFGPRGKSLDHTVELPPDTGLLYPHPDARELRSLAPHERPQNLLLLDGTWAHANRLYKDNKWLSGLPHFAITPTQKSRYLVRREPNEKCLSTLEAAVEALRCLEPDLAGLDALLALFERMNTEQVQRKAVSPRRPRMRRTRAPSTRALHSILSQRAEDLVLLHAETPAIPPRRRTGDVRLFYGAAVRTSDMARWHGFVRPPQGDLTDGMLDRSKLARSDVEAFLSRAEFEQQLDAFLRPSDVLVAWNPRSYKLLPSQILGTRPFVQLKAAYCNWHGGAAGSLTDTMQRHGLTPPATLVPGRLGEQLARMQALAGLLQSVSETPTPSTGTAR